MRVLLSTFLLEKTAAEHDHLLPTIVLFISVEIKPRRVIVRGPRTALRR